MPRSLLIDTAGGANFENYHVRNIQTLHVGGSNLAAATLQVTGTLAVSGGMTVGGAFTPASINTPLLDHASGVQLAHAGAVKLETTATGVTVTGNLTATALLGNVSSAQLYNVISDGLIPLTIPRLASNNTWSGSNTFGTALVVSGATLGFYGASAIIKQAVTGSRSAGTALQNLLYTLALYGLITDSTTA